MAKTIQDSASAASRIIEDVKKGIFAPVYLLMGDEPYYVDLVYQTIMDYALDESERDFNQFVCYGADVDVPDIISNARRYPMFAERSLVAVKEAQGLKGIDNLTVYTDAPLDSTVLVLVYRGNPDKRKALYKSILKNGCVLESNPLRDYQMPRWISDYYHSRGLEISPDAAALLAEYAGTDLCRIASQTDKMLKCLPEGTTVITAADIEDNIGISREFSIFELTKQLSYRQTAQALRTASYIGAGARFAMPMATAALFTHFNRILQYGALLMRDRNPSPDKKAAVLGVNPYFFKEYEAAVKNYPVRKAMTVIALLRDYDFKGKGGADAGEASAQELLVELVSKILFS